jgi:hypothetical protein
MSEIPERLARIETKLDMLIEQKERVDIMWDLKNKALGYMAAISAGIAAAWSLVSDAVASIFHN